MRGFGRLRFSDLTLRQTAWTFIALAIGLRRAGVSSSGAPAPGRGYPDFNWKRTAENISLVSAMLSITDLRKSFVSPDGERTQVVCVPTFALASGAQLALRGESGSGKTTFLNLIAGILRADSGGIRVGGIDLAPLSEAARDRLRAERLGYIFQTFNLLQGYTVLENVLRHAAGRASGPRPRPRPSSSAWGSRTGSGTFPGSSRPRPAAAGRGGAGACQSSRASPPGGRAHGEPRPPACRGSPSG